MGWEVLRINLLIKIGKRKENTYTKINYFISIEGGESMRGCRKNLTSIIFSVFLSWGLIAGSATLAFANEKQILANELAALVRAARLVISDNQDHINDPQVGDKGLSGEVVAAKAKENYKKMTGSDLPEGKVYQELLDSVKNVMSSAQTLINEPGKGFKGFLPAIFAKGIADDFSKKMVGKISIKLTAPKAYVRNLANRPDSWEHNIIENKFKSPDWPKNQSFSENVRLEGKDSFRLILPEYYGQSCLACHGEPKGERDITGGKKEGAKLGELGGAISIIVY
jgi:hypothetical protein